MTRPADTTWRRLETAALVLIALHSYAVGVMLMVFTRWSAEFGGWGAVEPLFFARQGGIFHVVLATGYLVEYFRRGEITLLLIAKSTALVFLLVMWRLGGPWAEPLSGVADGLMGAVMYLLHRRATRSARP